jgi:hypothetical protein
MEAVRTSETLVNFYQTTRCYNPEDSNLHTHRREHLKSYLAIKCLPIIAEEVATSEKSRSRVVENSVQKRVFGPNREKITGG